MSGNDKKSTKLPSKTNDTVVDVSLKHVIIGFTVFVGSTLAVTTTVVLLRDYSKYKRQKAIIDSCRELILLTVQKGDSIEPADETQNKN